MIRILIKLAAIATVSVLLFANASFAKTPGEDLKFALPSFQTAGHPIVFVDILKSNANVTFDIVAQKLKVTSTVEFYQEEKGYPVLDLLPSATNIVLNGNSIPVTSFNDVRAPDNSDTFRFLEAEIPARTTNTVVITHESNGSYHPGLRFSQTGVTFDGSSSNYVSRSFLELFIVSGLEYDQFSLIVDIQVTGTTIEHQGYFNGLVQRPGLNHWVIEFPETYSSSSFFFDILEGPQNEFRQVYQSMNGPVDVLAYGPHSGQRFVDSAVEILKVLETDFGAYPHPFLIIKAVSRGGMEQSGAVRADYNALFHEIVHCYFGRSVRPASGDAGWVDEAIATWYVDWGQGRDGAGFGGSPVTIAGQSRYRRGTDPSSAYRKGPAFVSKLDQHLAPQGGAMPALKDFFTRYRDQIITTDMFRESLELSTGQNLKAIFDQYVYGLAPAKP